MSRTADFERLLAIENRLPALKQLVDGLARVYLDNRSRDGLEALRAVIDDIEAWDLPTSPDVACQCTYEAGDSPCTVHPSCPGCGSMEAYNEIWDSCNGCGYGQPQGAETP